MVGELDAGNPHVQFDEGAQETCDSATRLCPTLRSPWLYIRLAAFGANYATMLLQGQFTSRRGG